jgi:hypothetical protein
MTDELGLFLTDKFGESNDDYLKDQPPTEERKNQAH